MSQTPRSIAVTFACVLWAAVASAQAPASQASSDEINPLATTTFFGDTGIWFVPTGEVLPAGKWSVSGYRRGTNYIQGYTNVGDFAGTVAYGVKDKAEVFASFLFDTRIDRDLRPLFGTEQDFAGIVSRYPKVHTGWTGDNVGDFYVGVKFNLISQLRKERPAAVAVRVMLKFPTASSDAGSGTGSVDGSFDFIVSREIARAVQLSGYAGYQFWGSPDGFDTPGGAFDWGIGTSYPSRKPLRVFGELSGDVLSGSTATITGSSLVGDDGSFAPPISSTENLTRATGGVTYQSSNGFFAGVGLTWSVPTHERLANRQDSADAPFGDYPDWQVRIGYHPGARKLAAPVPPASPAPPAPPPPAPAPAPTHNLTVKAECNPCTVQVGQSSQVTATVQDSINCAVTYRWSAPSGTFANPAQRQTQWTATQQEGAVPVTVTVTCPTDNKTASDTVRIDVNRPAPVVQLTFEDVFFDFDRYSLRPEALRLLDDAVAKLQANADKQLIIEGHTCSIGTAEYNLALGERRAAAVRDYLTSRGVPAARLETRSYGEERPKYDNAREETRRLNRRAALVVKVQ